MGGDEWQWVVIGRQPRRQRRVERRSSVDVQPFVNRGSRGNVGTMRGDGRGTRVVERGEEGFVWHSHISKSQ